MARRQSLFQPVELQFQSGGIASQPFQPFQPFQPSQFCLTMSQSRIDTLGFWNRLVAYGRRADPAPEPRVAFNKARDPAPTLGGGKQRLARMGFPFRLCGMNISRKRRLEILAVDDEPTVLRSIKMLLEHDGHLVHAVECGKGSCC